MPEQQTRKIRPVQIFILCFLLLFVPPVGILYAGWLMAGAKGVVCGCGCLLLPTLLLIAYLWYDGLL